MGEKTDVPHGGLMVEVGLGNSNDFTEVLEGFKADHGVHFVLAISGGADDDSPILRHFVDRVEGDGIPAEAKQPLRDLLNASKTGYIAEIVRDILRPLRGYRIAIQTGGTKWGVPAIATQVANEFGFPTIGVFPLTAKDKHGLPLKVPREGAVAAIAELDLAVCVHPFAYESQWGDESPIYTKMLDSVVVIGGGAGTMVEVAHILKLNERKELRKKHIIPVYGTGGTADKLSFFPGKPKTMATCIPSHPITSGREACDYLLEHVVSDDIYEPPTQS